MPRPIRCECGALFGIEEPDGSLTIKYRDLVRSIRGSVTGQCRKCHKVVTWPDLPYTIPTWRVTLA